MKLAFFLGGPPDPAAQATFSVYFNELLSRRAVAPNHPANKSTVINV
jgi:hypothetical protein